MILSHAPYVDLFSLYDCFSILKITTFIKEFVNSPLLSDDHSFETNKACILFKVGLNK